MIQDMKMEVSFYKYDFDFSYNKFITSLSVDLEGDLEYSFIER